MHLKRLRARCGHSRIAIALIVLLGLLLPAIPAHAIVGSTTDGAEKYPWVGAAWLVLNGCCEEGWPGGVFPNPIPPDLPLGDNRVRATGILIAPNVFLTQAGSFRNGRRVAVSVERSIENWQDGTDYVGLEPGDTVVTDTILDDTVYEGYVFHYSGPGDIAVIILDEDVAGPLATLAAPGTLDTLNANKPSQGKALLTVVSYGPPNNNPETWDFQRRTSTWRLNSLKASTVHLQGPGYSVCDGDQGAPIIDAKGDVAALLVFSPTFCSSNSFATGYRLDTQPVRDFLCGLSDGSLDLNDEDNISGTPDGTPDLQQVNNPNDPLLVDQEDSDGYLQYDISSASAVALDKNYCPPLGSVGAASPDDGGKQSADHDGKSRAERHHKAKHTSKHKKGGKHRR